MTKIRRKPKKKRRKRVDPELAAYWRKARTQTERFTKLKVGARIMNVISKKVGRFEGLIERSHPFLMVSYMDASGRHRDTVWYVDNVSTKAVS
jgi:hypothetical protein